MSHCHMDVFVEQFMTQKYKRNAARLRVQRQIDLGSADTSEGGVGPKGRRMNLQWFA